MRAAVTFVSAMLFAGCCQPCCPTLSARASGSVSPQSQPAQPRNALLAAAERHGRGSPAVWSFLASTYDKDRNGQLTAAEYSRDPKTFQRLDRDKDGTLTAADFAGPTVMEEYMTEFVWRRLSRLEDDARPTEGLEGPGEPLPLEADLLAKALRRGDASRDGLLTEPELMRALQAAEAVPTKAMPDLPKGVRPFFSMLAVQDGDRDGRLSLAEVENWRVRAAAQAKQEAEEARKQAAAKAEGTQQAPQPPAPAPARPAATVGEQAPAFSLATLAGAAEVSLASYQGKKPVALIFGSYTCPPFRYTATRLRQIVDAHLGSVQFLFIYIREAHAVDGRSPLPAEDQPLVEEPTTIAERATVAGLCALDLGFDRFPTLVDGLDNAVARAYAAPPARLYVIGIDGKVAYKSGPGPFGLDPEAFEAAIRKSAAR